MKASVEAKAFGLDCGRQMVDDETVVRRFRVTWISSGMWLCCKHKMSASLGDPLKIAILSFDKAFRLREENSHQKAERKQSQGSSNKVGVD